MHFSFLRGGWKALRASSDGGHRFFLFSPFFLPHGDALVLVLGRERAHGEVEAAGGREGLVVVAGATGGGEGEHHGKKANV